MRDLLTTFPLAAGFALVVSHPIRRSLRAATFALIVRDFITTCSRTTGCVVAGRHFMKGEYISVSVTRDTGINLSFYGTTLPCEQYLLVGRSDFPYSRITEIAVFRNTEYGIRLTSRAKQTSFAFSRRTEIVNPFSWNLERKQK